MRADSPRRRGIPPSEPPGADRYHSAPMAPPSLSIVVPVFNEARVLERTVAELTAGLGGLGRSYEIVLVDDGSRDASAEILARLAAHDGRLRLERLPQNRGKG